jgi:cell division GTPase FtsZ
LGQAINSLTLKANIEDAARILVLISAPKDVTTLSVLSEISNSVQEKSPKAVLRIGDYPRRGKEISVSIILSQLTAVARMEGLFLQAELLLKNQEKIEEETAQKVKLMHQTSSNIPPLA